MGEVHGHSAPPCAEVTYRSADASDVQRIVSLLTETFAEDPWARCLFPDPGRRRVLLPAYFAVTVQDLLTRGDSYLNLERTGVRLFVPAASPRPSPPQAQRLRQSLRAATQEYAETHVLPLFDFLDQLHPRDTPHYFLVYAAVDRAHQGRGIGSGLLRPILRRCDQERVGAYAECTTAGSRRLLQRHGFLSLPEVTLPDGTRIHPVWRDPRPWAP